ncbi:flagellar basal-body rod protein FlgF [Ramlibacter alkalitolerans]|uniref:Flagellar basal-body rod protein FlgF n=1 Tax=Ramlibacter alkalitolerans TaxID=2039631 RepID=A0ABS1JKV5_9BURK|nr:flagellar basal-body rod protein FlgF [Ramlibacter alkalitolerans]MBL0424857.1 flagellar basal-body rod protein FlgF [Ramlibacter alkalitolerans]
MDRLIYTAASAARALMQRQDGITNNLANASTPGFRADLVAFRAVPVRGEGAPTRVVALEATAGFDERSGPVETTGRNLDVAVLGPGYVAVQAPDGSEAYTRGGALQVSAEGTLVTAAGLPVAGEGGTLNIPVGTTVNIARDGTVSAQPATGAAQTVGRIKLVNPAAADLRKGDDGLLRMASGEDAPADPAVRLGSGALEGSNVNVVEAMVGMIAAARQYETQMKLLQNAEQNDQRASQLLAPAR